MPRKCQYRKKDGTPCEADAQSGKNLCVFHDPIQAEKVRRARQAGGRKNRAAIMPANTPHLSLNNGADAVSLLGDTINRIRTGELDPRVANSIGYLCGILLRAFEVNNVEDRLATLETAVIKRPRAESQVDVQEFEFIPDSEKNT
jgi:hypothetical protein